jgi:hypothetical protein
MNNDSLTERDTDRDTEDTSQELDAWEDWSEDTWVESDSSHASHWSTQSTHRDTQRHTGGLR